MPRLGHKKSRLGCRQCKTRHVKCDELKPCSNCARHGVPCSLLTGDPKVPQQVPPATPAASVLPNSSIQTPIDKHTAIPPSIAPPSLHIEYVLNPSVTSPSAGTSTSAISDASSPASQPDNAPFLTRLIHKSEGVSSKLWVCDLELMHHWAIEAYSDLSHREDMQYTWRTVVPQNAVAHTFLMHELLAFSAFHKAHKLPDRRSEYYTIGIHHQDLAIRGIREKIQNVTQHEAAAIVATSTLLTLSVFASTGFEATCADIGTNQNAIDSMLNIFNLMQGMGNVLAIAQRSVMESFLAPMFRDSTEPIPSQPMLGELVKHIPPLTTFIQSYHNLPEPERNTYLEVIAHFEPVLQLAMPPNVDNRELRFLFFWPLHLQQNFLSYTRNRHSGALAILMFYATLLYASEPRYWFMEGWGNRLMHACYESMEQSWMPAIQWPLSFLNHSATYDLFANLVRTRRPQGEQPQAAFTQRALVTIPHRENTVPPLMSYEQRAGSGLPQHVLDTTQQQDQKPMPGILFPHGDQ
ncbi:hypothetical protein ACN47E_002010 [Coniothyrium glycines]